MVVAIVLCGAAPFLYVPCQLCLEAREAPSTSFAYRPFYSDFLTYRPILERTLPLLQRQRLSLALLNGGECPGRELLIGWAAESIGLSYLIACLSSLLGMMAGNPTLLVMGVIVACCLPVLRTKELTKKVNQRRFIIIMELPELLSRLLLMVNAGETVLRALSRCAEQKADSEHPLYVELNRAIEGMKRGESLSLVLEEMGRRCAVPEVRLFATTVLINARRGESRLFRRFGS